MQCFNPGQVLCFSDAGTDIGVAAGWADAATNKVYNFFIYIYGLTINEIKTFEHYLTD